MNSGSFQPKYLYGLPSYMLEFAARVKLLNRDPSDLKLDLLIVTGEVLHPEQSIIEGVTHGFNFGFRSDQYET